MKSNQPAHKLVLAKTEIKAHLPGADGMRPLTAPLEVVAANAVEAPSALTRSHAKAGLLSVNCEYRELRLCQRTCK